jgi:hypothetical protein
MVMKLLDGVLLMFKVLLLEAQSRLDNLNFVESIGNEASTNLLNTALEDVIFNLSKWMKVNGTCR